MAKTKKTTKDPSFDPTTPKDLGRRLKSLRESRALSQKQLAEAAQLSQATIAQIETGKKDPSVQTLRKLAKAMDIHIATMFVDGDVHVFDLPRLRRKYKTVDDLSAGLYMAIGKVVQYAKDIGFI